MTRPWLVIIAIVAPFAWVPARVAAQECASPGAGWGGGGLGGGGAAPCPPLELPPESPARYVTYSYEIFEPSCTFESTAIRYRRFDTVTGESEEWQVCLRPPNPGEPAVLPLAPPAPSEVWGHLPIPNEPVGISPPTQGLVGFETWLWHTGTDHLTMTLELPPFWTLTVDAVAQSFSWDMGNGDLVSATHPGRDGAPATTYTYQQTCYCDVTATVTWAGHYTVAMPGLEPFTISLGSRQFSGDPFPYPVVEVQAIVTGGS